MAQLPTFLLLPRLGIRLLAVALIMGTAARPATAETEYEAGSGEAAYLEQIELRSMVNLPGGELFSLRDPQNERSFWIESGESRYGIEVVAFDLKRLILRVRHGEAVREIPLSHARIRDVKELAREDRERILVLWRARVEERRGFNERWEVVLEESRELQEIQEQAKALFGELGELRETLEGEEPGTAAYARIREKQKKLTEEYRLMEQYLRHQVSTHPGFEREDVETFDILLQLVNHAWPEFE